MFHFNHQVNKPLNGPNGYKRLVRLVARAFYSGECPPREPEDNTQPAPFRSRGQKHYFPGLGVLLVDLLAHVDGYVDEDDVCRALRLSQKNVRKALRYLEGERLLSSQDVKFRKPRQKPGEAAAAAPGGVVAKQKPGQQQQQQQQQQPEGGGGGGSKADAGKAAAKGKKAAGASAGAQAGEEEEDLLPVKKETKVFWCVDYPGLKDSLRLRLHRLREFIREQAPCEGCARCARCLQVQDKNPLQSYRCPRCGANFSSLDAIRLLDPMAGVFRCEDCREELEEHVEGAKQDGAGAGVDRKSHVAHYRELQAALESQLRPITEQLERLKDLDPPDYGSLQEFFAEQQAARQRQAKREANAAQRAAAAAAGGEAASATPWYEAEEVQVDFGSGAGAAGAAAAAEPGKEVPIWFRMGQASGLAQSNDATTSDATAEPAGAPDTAAALAGDADRERQRQIQEAYLAQYLADVARAKAAAAAGGGGLDDKKDVKRIKTETGWAAAGEGAVKSEPEPKPEPLEGGWKQEQQEQQQPQQPQQEQAPLAEDDFGQWEDVAPEEQAAGGAAGVAAVPGEAGDEDFEWEDA